MTIPMKDLLQDAFGSNLTGSGMSMDKRTSYGLIPSYLSPQSAILFYENSDVAQKVVDVPVNDAFRVGWEIQVSDNPDMGTTLSNTLQDMNYESILKEALRQARCCGGSVILMHTADPDYSKPLIPGTPIVRLHVFTSGVEVIASQEIVDTLSSPRFGLPMFYNIQNAGGITLAGLNKVHYSRLIIMNMPTISRMQLRTNFGFGPSILGNLQLVIRDYEVAFSDALGTISEFSQSIIGLNGLNQAMSAAGSTDDATALKNRLMALNISRSMYKAIFLDNGGQGQSPETFTRVGQPLAGLSDLLEKATQRLSLASKIPVPLLNGENAAGLNATGDSSIRAYYDMVATLQQTYLTPAITQLIKAVSGKNEPEQYKVKFHPLWCPTDEEQSITRKNQAETDQIYYTMGALSAEEIRLSRFSGDGYSSHTNIDTSLAIPNPVEGT